MITDTNPLNGPSFVSDVVSTTTGTSGNSGIISDAYTGVGSFLVNVTAQSGTTPTLDLALQETSDGVTFTDIYHVPRFAAATGTYRVPNIPLGGARRWAWTIAGTTPSFTFKITTCRTSLSDQFVRNFYDRTIVLNTLSSTTPWFDIEGCWNICASVCSGAAAAPATLQMQFSGDQTNVFTASGNLVTVANSTVAVPCTVGLVAKWARLIVTSAGTTQTLTHAQITGTI